MWSVMIDAITAHLKELLAHHLTLLEISEQKRQALIKNQVKDLTAYVNQENRIVKQIAGLESQWVGTAAAFAAGKGLKRSTGMTISDVIKLMDHQQDRETIVALKEELLGTIEMLKKQNALNQQLIEHSLNFINYSLDLYTGDFAQDAVYHRPTQAGVQGASRKSKAWFDTRA